MFEPDDGRLTIGEGRNKLSLEWLRPREAAVALRATLVTKNLTATHVVNDQSYASIEDADFRQLPAMLESLASDWRGWDGDRAWYAADGDFIIRCLHDGISAVVFKVSLRDWDDEWELTDIPLTTELGHLTTLADEARMFGDALQAQ